MFRNNPSISKGELRTSFLGEIEELKKNYESGKGYLPISMVIEAYMDEAEVPDEKIAMEILENLKKEENIPYGSYMVLLYGNLINSETGEPVSEAVGNRREEYERY